MNKELKDAIIEHVQHNADDFQLHNNTIDKFRQYIYTAEGNYNTLISGQKVAGFIGDFIKLYTK